MNIESQKYSRRSIFIFRNLLFVASMAISIIAIGEYFSYWDLIDREATLLSNNIDKPEDVSCDGVERYGGDGTGGGGILIGLRSGSSPTHGSDSSLLLRNYQDFLLRHNIDEDEGGRSGVWISKKAIDYMFDKKCDANGLFCYFAMDERQQRNILFQPARRDNFNIKTDAAIDSDDLVFFKAESFCPTNCGF